MNKPANALDRKKIILALDVPSFREARSFVKKFKRELDLFKVGSYLFTSCGPDVVRMIHDEGGRVFLDLKYHDIPNTVATACEAAARLGVFLVDIHTSGGAEMMARASEAVGSFGKKRPLLIGVTVLTSDQNKSSVRGEVLKRTRLALANRLDGVVCSPQETAFLRSRIKSDFLIVNPGIRFSSNDKEAAKRKKGKDDQKRVSTPEMALKSGASYLVIGRPLLEAQDSKALLRSIAPL